MGGESPFLIYNASAGSGKTFTLVKRYLKILLASQQKHAFKNILALTFTNKAVAEMKERILGMLMAFSDEAILKHPTPMFELLMDELKIDASHLHKQSKDILNAIVHNYASFEVSTIDKFNYRLLRTFAHDLKLPLNFEVEMDTDTILAKAVDRLIDKAGSEKELTRVLVEFATEKTDEDKSWDVSYDFNQIATLLLNENDRAFVELLKDKTFDDFKTLKDLLYTKILKREAMLVKAAETVLGLIESNGLQYNDFSRSFLPNYFKKLESRDFNVNFGLNWQNDLLEGNAIYPAKLEVHKKDIIDRIQPDIADVFKPIEDTVYQLRFYRNAYNNSRPLSVLNAIYKTLQEIKQDEELLLSSEFNSLISAEIKSQPAPFIYERIGEKFRHYFIDEFQDTSVMQWENLIPLIDNAVSGQNLKGESGTAMLVGDAKQAIYRWRGGKAEQFIDLYTGLSRPFHIKQQVENLPVNYRSLKSIVNFNNGFFKHLSTFVFNDETHKQIYGISHQEPFLEGEGLVELNFLEFEREDKDNAYGQHVLETIQKVQNHGFEWRDMCVITRRRAEGKILAEYLSVNGVPVISSESLLLINAPEVGFLAAIIALASQPHNDMLKMEVLAYLVNHQLQVEDNHVFFEQLVHLEVSRMFKKLEHYQLFFDFNRFLQLPFYEAVEHAIRQFHLDRTPNAYLQFFLDEVLDYSRKNDDGFSSFTTYWEVKKEKLSISSPQGGNAVQIMTIHKSKGLEFPVVIFPYANQNIYSDKFPKSWFPVNPDKFKGFSNLYVSSNKDLESFDEVGQSMYLQYRAQLELDHINLLYVVLTRAVEQLYILSEYDVAKDQKEKLTLYSGLFMNYLKTKGIWEDSKRIYTFGTPEPVLAKKEPDSTETLKRFISIAKENHNLNIVTKSGRLWNTVQENAIEKGNLVHLILSKTKSGNDIRFVFDDLENRGELNAHQRLELEPIINTIVYHEQLKAYFLPGLVVYNEKDIMVAGGGLFRPDRIVIKDAREAVIIDYKTGAVRMEHENQLIKYQTILEQMGFDVIKKILVYINEDIQVKEL